MKFKCVLIEKEDIFLLKDLLQSRGEKLTMFLGSQVMENIIEN